MPFEKRSQVSTMCVRVRHSWDTGYVHLGNLRPSMLATRTIAFCLHHVHGCGKWSYGPPMVKDIAGQQIIVFRRTENFVYDYVDWATRKTRKKRTKPALDHKGK